MYCVYVTTYSGKLLPKYYVGSTSLKRLKEGYRGSVSSFEYSRIWNDELISNPELFDVEIISKHKTRKNALKAELNFQIKNDVVDSEEWINKSLAIEDGFFGMNVSGKNNPMFGKSRKGEKHKGGHNISKGLQKYYSSEKSKKTRELFSRKMSQNNPSKNPKIMIRIKETWKINERNVGNKNGMYGKKSPMNGKKLYNDGNVTKAFVENKQPKGWNVGRHKMELRA